MTWESELALDEAEVTVARIRAIVAEAFGITAAALDARGAELRIARPRQIALRLAAEMTALTPASLGALFGGRDRRTVVDALATSADWIDRDPEFRLMLEALRERVEAGARGPQPAPAEGDRDRGPKWPEFQRPRPERAAVRTCLTCRAWFESEGPHNRICGACKPRVNAAAATPW